MDRALDLLKRTISIDPGDWYGHFLLGWTLRRAGRLRAAEISYSKAVAIDAQDPRLKATVGEFYLAIEKLELAAERDQI